MKFPKLKSHVLHVNEEILNTATPSNSRYCMVAQAVRKQIAGASSVDVTAERIKFNLPDGLRYSYDTPAKVGIDIAIFDRVGKLAVKPFSFRLRANQCSIAPQEPKRKHVKSKHSKTRQPGPRRSCVRRFHGLKVIT